MTRTSERVIEGRKRALLEYVAERSRALQIAPDMPVETFLSLSGLSAELGLSVSQTRCLVRRLTDDSFLAVIPRYLPNGGQLENAFRVTPAGLAFLRDNG